MLKNVFVILGEFFVTFSVLVSTYHYTYSAQFEKQLKLIDEDPTINDTELIEESKESNTGNETLFWTPPDTKNTTEVVVAETDVPDIQDVKQEDEGSFITEENVEMQSNNSRPVITETTLSEYEPTNEEKNDEVIQQVSKDSIQMNEKITLQRNNCQAEIAVYENSDIKLTIKFGYMQNNSYGRCCLTLRGHENSMLGVLISNVHLYRNNTQGEVLKVIVGDRYSAFVLKEYYGSRDYEPLLLTESHKVYLVLYYKVENLALNQDCTYFNLEVFTYQKYENKIHHYEEHKDNYNHLYAAYANSAA